MALFTTKFFSVIFPVILPSGVNIAALMVVFLWSTIGLEYTFDARVGMRPSVVYLISEPGIIPVIRTSNFRVRLLNAPSMYASK